jgi:putative Mg2+ transporter-C (MgtC) family protein
MDSLDQLALVGRLLYAALLGSIIGLERELRGYPAGVRTVGLVVLGAAFFTEISRAAGPEDRIAAGIVTGIGFIGAGLIFREGYTVTGITTAATVWAAAAIGMAVGREMLLAAGLTTLIVFFWLEARPLVRLITDVVRRWFPIEDHTVQPPAGRSDFERESGERPSFPAEDRSSFGRH